jgi:Uma2 family endonuclease
MKLKSRTTDIEYPASDGKPMGETDVHRGWMIRLIDMLMYRYRAQRVYVSGDLLVYYEEGNPRKFVVPDVFVVKDCDPGQRRVFKIWEELRVPNTVFEMTSRKTKRQDQAVKPQVYAGLRIPEYFLYDPTGDYLNPRLQGHRLVEDRYCPIEPDTTGALVCEQLDLLLRLESGRLELFDRSSGERLLTEGEAERAAREREQQAREAERLVREAQHRDLEAERLILEEERRARLAAEAEVERLRKLLEQRDDNGTLSG